jgi:hypothetical protein
VARAEDGGEVIGMCEDVDLLEALTEAWVALSLHLLRKGYCHRASCAAWVAALLKEAADTTWGAES